jgi:hypothetical protein
MSWDAIGKHREASRCFQKRFQIRDVITGGKSSMKKLNSKNIHTLMPDDGKDDQFFADDSLPNFGVRVRIRPNGTVHRTFGLLYRANGEQHRTSLDEVGKISLDDARAAARRHFGQILLFLRRAPIDETGAGVGVW